MADLNASVLIIDDEPDIRELLGITLRRMGLQVIEADNLKNAKSTFGTGNFDLCLTDMRLPDGDGLEFVRWLQETGADTPCAVITAHGNIESAVQALKFGAFDFVSKPVNIDDLRRLVDTALKLGAATPEAEADDSSPQLLGDSPAIHKVRGMIAKVARSQAPVHISGESGTGKELAAKMIHAASARRDAPFVPVNCGAIPSELMESEFFGHKKGSFTGAHVDKEGLFQAANGGTLFLDEVADLPLHMQVKLLRVIQEKAIRPVGAAREINVNVRILSATHRNLAELVAAGKFREDLFYRINVIELHIPALRERRNDIPVLAGSLLKRLSRSLEIPTPTLDAGALEKLQQYGFPGNVRELENILERALTLASGNVIHGNDIDIRKSATSIPATLQDSTPRATDFADVSDRPSHLGDAERDTILAALEATRYNRTRAAEKLGLTLRQLRYRIQKLGLDDE